MPDYRSDPVRGDPSSAGDRVTPTGAVRKDTGADLAGADGDYAPLQMDASGNLRVNIAAGTGGTSATDDSAFTVGTTSGTPIMGLADETTPDSVDEGDVGVVRMTADRKLLVRVVGSTDGNRAQVDANGAVSAILASNSGVDVGDVTINNSTGASAVNIQDGGNSITVDGTITATPTGTQDVNVTQIAGATTAVGSGVLGTGTQRVVLATDQPAIPTITTVTTVSTLTGGGVAHDGADSGNPHKIGAKAETSLSTITKVIDGDRTDLYAGVDGVLITRPHCNLEDISTGNASNTDGTSTSVIASAGGSVKTYLTLITLVNTSATNTYCEIKDGTTVKLTIPAPANSGAIIPLPVPLPGSAATAWNFDMGTAVTTAYCSMVGFKSLV